MIKNATNWKIEVKRKILSSNQWSIYLIEILSIFPEYLHRYQLLLKFLRISSIVV